MFCPSCKQVPLAELQPGKVKNHYRCPGCNELDFCFQCRLIQQSNGSLAVKAENGLAFAQATEGDDFRDLSPKVKVEKIKKGNSHRIGNRKSLLHQINNDVLSLAF